jgi:protein-S-isoprenylcysteine O-methyltransferase Ste14
MVPLVIRIPVAVIVLSISLYVAITGMNLVFGKNRGASGVIRKGVFKLVRHPIYLSEILLYFGLLMLNMSLAATVIWIAGIIFLHYISRYEEKLLLERFGEEYTRYMKEVAMWIPGVRKR